MSEMVDANVNGHISTQTNIEGGNYNPIKVEITNQPIEDPKYVPSISGTYHFESRGGFLLLKDTGGYNTEFVLGERYLSDLIISMHSNYRIDLYDPYNDVTHMLNLNNDLGITVDSFINVLESLKHGVHTVGSPVTQSVGKEHV